MSCTSWNRCFVEKNCKSQISNKLIVLYEGFLENGYYEADRFPIGQFEAQYVNGLDLFFSLGMKMKFIIIRILINKTETLCYFWRSNLAT